MTVRDTRLTGRPAEGSGGGGMRSGIKDERVKVTGGLRRAERMISGRK